MPIEFHYGMDHPHYDWAPFNRQRCVLRWPQNARIALCVIVTLEHMEWRTPEGAFQSASLAGGYGPSPFPMSPAGRIGSMATGSGCFASWRRC